MPAGIGYGFDPAMLAGIFNQNIKNMGPNGIEFFDDSNMLQNIISGATGGLALSPTSPPVANAGQAVAPAQTAQTAQTAGQATGGQAQKDKPGFFENPNLYNILGQFGQALLPGSPLGNLGGVASQQIQAQLFNQVLQQLLKGQQGGGQQQNPNLPAALAGAAGLSPEAQLQLVNTFQQNQQMELAKDQSQLEKVLGLRSLQSADVGDLLNYAEAVNLFQQPPGKQDLKVEVLGVDPQGNKLPAGQGYKYVVNLATGERIAVGPDVLPEPGSDGAGSGEKPSQKANNINLLRRTLMAQFAEPIYEGMRSLGLLVNPKTGDKIVSSGQLLSLLRDPDSGFDIDTVELALSQQPDAFAEFSNRLAEASNRLDGGEGFGTILQDLRRNNVRKAGPKPLTGFNPPPKP